MNSSDSDVWFTLPTVTLTDIENVENKQKCKVFIPLFLLDKQ